MTDPVLDSVNSYDAVPYPSTPYRGTHPDTLATLGTLVGMKPAPIDRCRVLELGCSDGGNLLPMAYGLPGSEFVGLDSSARQIELGLATLETLGLKNITLKQTNLLDVGDQFGKFDYIIAHGIYSWVSPDVQDKILEICNCLLKPQGLSFVSYNTYPGWHMRGMIREMMLYHIRRQSEAEAKVAGARALLSFLTGKVGTPETANLTATDTSAYSAVLRYEQSLLAQYSDSYLFHEHLEDINHPVYFSEFIERASRHNLQYVSEADFVSAQIVNFAPAVAETIRSMAADLIETQQYMDFVTNRTFRQTVLCRADVSLTRTLDPDRLSPFYIASPIKPAADSVDLASFKEETFNTHIGKTLTTGVPAVKAALFHLGAIWPLSVGFEALVAAAHERLEPGAPHVFSTQKLAQDSQVLGQTLLQCFAQGMAEFRVHPALYTTEIASRPTASAVARLQARTSATVANLRHEQVTLDDVSRHVLVYLDGEHDRAELFNTLAKLADEGVVVAQSADGKPAADEAERNTLLAEALNLALQKIAGSALLIH